MSKKQIQAVLLVAVLVVSVAVAGMASAASAGSISASPDDPGATATHTTTVTIGSNTGGDSWNGFQVNYTASDVSNVGQGDVTTIGIDRGDNDSGSTIDVNVSDDLSSVSGSNDGETLTIGLGGNYDLTEGDEVVVVYGNVQNPSSTGDYDVGMEVNHQSGNSGDETTAQLSITSDSNTTTTTPTTTTTTQSDDETTQSDDGDTTTEIDIETPVSTTTQTTTTTDDSEVVNASGAYVDVHPEEPNASASHEVTITVGSETAGDSWNGLEVNYSGTGTDVSDVGQNDVERIGIDRGDDSPGAMLDVNVSDDLSSVSGSEDGSVLTVGLGGNYDLQEGDEVVVVYEDVQNPPENVYNVPVDVNPQSTGGTAAANMPVLGSMEFTTTATDTATATDTPTETTDAGGTTATDTSTTTTEGTPTAESPGFGSLMALLALLAAAALLARR